jgi:hypothetical protein
VADGHITDCARRHIAVERLGAATEPRRRFVRGQQAVERAWPLAALARGLLLCVLDLDLAALRLRVLRPPPPRRLGLLPRIRRRRRAPAGSRSRGETRFQGGDIETVVHGTHSCARVRTRQTREGAESANRAR